MLRRQKKLKETKKSSSAKLSENGVRMLLRGEVAEEGVVLQVVQLYRYLIDDYFNTRTGIETTAEMFAYDLVLSDGRFKTKCLMDPSLNKLVNKGHLRVNTTINILAGHKYADELTVGAIQYFQVTRLEVVDSNVENLLRDQSKQNGITFHVDDKSTRVRSTLPLYSRQMFYLPFGNSDCMDVVTGEHIKALPSILLGGSMNLQDSWKVRNLVSDQTHDMEAVDQSSPTIQMIIDSHLIEFRSRRKKRGGGGAFNDANSSDNENNQDYAQSGVPLKDLARIRRAPLIGRIVNKTRLLKLPERRRKCPYYFMIELKDGSLGLNDVVTVSLWETMCPKYFNSLYPGQIVRIHGYRFGQNHLNDFEFKLNSDRNVHIEVLSSANFKRYMTSIEDVDQFKIRFPNKLYPFTQIKSIIRMPVSTPTKGGVLRTYSSIIVGAAGNGNGLFDIVGVVSYVGPILRTRKIVRNLNSVESDTLALYRDGSHSSSEKNESVIEPIDFSLDAEFSECRWVKLRDGTCACDLVVLIYTNSQPGVFRKLKAGQFLVMTNLKLESPSRVYRAFESRSIWAISTLKSRYVVDSGIDRTRGFSPGKGQQSKIRQLFNLACSKYEIDPELFKSRIETVYNWWRDEKEFYNIEFHNMHESSQGADYVKVSKLLDEPDCFYRPSRLRPSAIADYTSGLASHSRLRDLKFFTSNMHFYESKVFAIQVRIDGFSMLDNNDREGDNEGSEDSDTDDVEDTSDNQTAGGVNRKVINRLLLEASTFLQRDDSTNKRKNIVGVRRSKRLRGSKDFSSKDSKGDRVEAKLKGWNKYYKGTITKENRDGTFNILFDDGERESKVDAKLIRSLQPNPVTITNAKREGGKSSDDENSNGNKVKTSRETTGKRRKHNIIVRTTKDKNSSQGYIGKGITPSFALSVKDLNTGEKLNIFYEHSPIMGVPFLPKNLEMLRRADELSPSVLFLVSPFASSNLLSSSCCSRLASFGRPDEGSAASTIDMQESAQIAQAISDDLRSKHVVVYLTFRKNLQSEEKLLLESVVLPEEA